MSNMHKGFPRPRTAIPLAASLALSLVLSACGGGGGGGSDPTSLVGDTSLPATTNTAGNTGAFRLTRFTVTGPAQAVNGRTPIDANLRGGAFEVAWETSGGGLYRVDLYVSRDQVLDSQDIAFFGQNCQEGFGLMRCGRSGRFQCRFTTENRISCGTISSINREKDLTAFLQGLPQPAYLILSAQDGSTLVTGGKPQTIAVPVVFR